MRKTTVLTACALLCCSIVAGRLLARRQRENSTPPRRAASNTLSRRGIQQTEPPQQPEPQRTSTEQRDYKVVHVFVALCDNEHQGIVPVPTALGNGQDPRSNLYWGAMYGVKAFFRKSPHWTGLKFEMKRNARVLERCVFKSVGLTPEVYVVAEAWDGRHMKAALLAFFQAAAGSLDTTITTNEDAEPAGRSILVGGRSDMVCFVGHNGLMDTRLSSFPPNAGANPNCAVVLACKSRDYFAKPLTAAKCRPLITTTGLMAPEAYTLDAIIRSWANGDNAATTRRKAGTAYATYQRISQGAAERLFATPAQ